MSHMITSRTAESPMIFTVSGTDKWYISGNILKIKCFSKQALEFRGLRAKCQKIILKIASIVCGFTVCRNVTSAENYWENAVKNAFDMVSIMFYWVRTQNLFATNIFFSALCLYAPVMLTVNISSQMSCLAAASGYSLHTERAKTLGSL